MTTKKFKNGLEILYGKDKEYGIDITYMPETRTLWLRFWNLYITFYKGIK